MCAISKADSNPRPVTAPASGRRPSRWQPLLRFAGALALVAAVVPLTACNDSNAADDHSAAPKFVVDPAWPKQLPNNWIIGQVAGVAVDRNDHIWVLHVPQSVPADSRANAAPPVLEFDVDGNLLRSWGGIVDVTPDMPIQSRESFGPVVTVTPFQEEDEVIRLANDSPYGLSASVWSGDLERAWRVARRLVTGNVSINNALATQANPALPFGGIKDSGFGRYKGEIGLHAFSNIKSIQVDRNSNRLEGYWYPYSKEKFELFSTIMEAAFGGGAFGLFKTIFNGLKLERFSRRHRL